MWRLSFMALCFAVALGSRNKIINLPGYNGPQLNQYTGYITVDEVNGRALFYWFFESQRSPSNDPLVFWFQGGPGCSGLIGLFSENGPYRTDMKGGLVYNPLSWTKFANVVFLEAPAGVGFSYSNTSSDYNTNDAKTAEDNYQFIYNFLKEFPQYSSSKIYLTGESYAGVYVPTLTSVILQKNDIVSQRLSGFAVGNPVFSCQSADYNAIQFNLFYWHGLVSQTVYSNWTSNGCDRNSNTDYCNNLFGTALNQIGVIVQQVFETDANQPSLDPDDLYQDFCTGNGTLDFVVNTGYPSQCNPVGTRTAAYLNRADVQKVIGAVPTTWGMCSNTLNYTISGASMVPLYASFFSMRPDLNILVYSGDVDIFTVPFGYTMKCLAELQDPLTSVWGPWFVNGATAGYMEGHQHYTFATVKGGGHETPQYQPLSSYNLISNYLSSTSGLRGNKLSSSNRHSKTFAKMNQGMMLKKYGIRG